MDRQCPEWSQAACDKHLPYSGPIWMDDSGCAHQEQLHASVAPMKNKNLIHGLSSVKTSEPESAIKYYFDNVHFSIPFIGSPMHTLKFIRVLYFFLN